MSVIATMSNSINKTGDRTAEGTPGSRPAWLLKLDVDAVYKWATLFIIPFYVISTSIRSEIFIFYAALFALKVWKSGYRKCGLEWFTLAAVIGLAVSYIGVWESRIIKNVLQVARIIVLPLLMSQYRPIPRLDHILAYIFSGLGIYGVIRMLFFPIITGYAQNRPYCFADFFMHSSVIAVSGFLFFLTMLIRKPGYRWKVLAAAGILIYLYLIMVHQVRASYLSVACITPLFLLMEAGRKNILRCLGACLIVASAFVLVGILRPAVVESAKARAMSIVDLEDGSNRGRIVIWKRALEVIREHPVNGIGYRQFNRFEIYLHNNEFDWSFAHAHNELLGMFAETGLIGLIAWLAFKFKLIMVFYRDRRQWIGAFLLYLLLAFELHNMFEYYLYERNVYIYVYVLLGLGLNQIVNREKQTAADPGSA